MTKLYRLGLIGAKPNGGAQISCAPFFMRKTTMPKLTDLTARAKPLLPGLMLSATIAAAASFLGAHYGAPVMLFALLLGMAFQLHAHGRPLWSGR